MGNTKYKIILVVLTSFIAINSFAQFAQSDHFNIIENNSTVLDVRINDSYAAGLYLTIPYQNDSGITFFPPQHGSIIFLNNYTIFYTPDSGFVGHDEFVYGIAVADKIYYAIDTARVFIEVIDQDSVPCQADIVFNINSNQVSFQGSNLFPISGNPTSYLWTFSDSTTSSAANPIHYFPNGSGQACLTINTTFGCSSTICDSIIIAGINCNAGYTYLQENCIKCYSLTDISSGTVLSWSWDFGDNIESAQQNPNHVFSDSGIYHVCLSIITDQNCQDTFCENIFVPSQYIVPSNCNASFSFLHSPQTECLNCFDFSDLSFENVISWNWQFGDGGTSEIQNPSHTFLIPGIYDVCLNIITADSCYSQYCHEVEAIEQISCSADFSLLINNNTVNFTDISNEAIVSWHWEFGDGTSSDLQNPQHIYSSIGHYQVCLTIITANGCTSSYCIDVQTISQIVEDIIFGGYVYAGDQILHDGIVILYDIEDNYKAVAWDYLYEGFWGFYTDTARKYLVYAIPEYDYELNLNKMYLPTYYGDTLFWQNADTVITDFSSITNDIHLQVANELMPYYGEGSIQGNVSYTCDSTYESLIYGADWFGCDTNNNSSHLLSNNARNMPVILMNENNQAVKFQLSSHDGLFSFSNMANNMYKIHTEKAGLLTIPISISLSNQLPDVTDISIVIGSTEISSGISNLIREELYSKMTLYPVPVKDVLHINVEAKLTEQSHIEITDAIGKIIYSGLYNLNQGSNLVNINTEQYNNGLYFVKFTTEKGRIYTTKFTK